MSELTEIPPEPVEVDESQLDPPNLKLSVATWLIPRLVKTQKYSVFPFSFFSALHLSSVLYTPAIAGPEVAEDIFSMARAVYQAPGLEETLVFGSCGVHVLSGVLLRICRKIKQNEEYGHKMRKRRVHTQKEKEQDPNYGLGGFYSIFGFGLKESIVSLKFGVSPISLSGYLLAALLTGHILTMRAAPLLIDGDSSLVGLGYISHIFHKSPFMVATALGALVSVSSYHMASGWLRIWRRSSLKMRQGAYAFIVGSFVMFGVAISRIGSLGIQTGFVGGKYDAYYARFLL